MFSPNDPNNPFDPTLTLVWDSPRLGSPAGIVFSDSDYKPSGIDIVKFDDLTEPNCAVPETYVTYTIVLHSKSSEQSNVTVTDILPYEADFISADPDSGTYFPDEHMYVWDNITLPDPNVPGDPNVYLTITVQVNYGAESESQMTNKVIVENDTAYDTAECSTDICCWGGDIIYVDKKAKWERIVFYGLMVSSGYNNGTSWENAYRNLDDALKRAGKGCGNEIWVAQGTYSPGVDYNDSFDVPAGVSVFGGFYGNEISRDERNIKMYETVLSGSEINTTVIRLRNSALLDGVSVTGSRWDGQGIYALNANAEVVNCVVSENARRGVFCDNGNLTVQWSEIHNNGEQGIYQSGSGKLLTIENCRIFDNQYDGVYTFSSTATILNSLIYQNGSGSDYYGIFLVNPYATPTIRNNTIVQNVNEGIRRNGGSVPTVKNCIIYFNNDEGTQLAGMNPAQITYCCISDCNDINDQHNINDLPGFVYADPDGRPIAGNYHLVWDSPCADAGDSASYTSEMDIDGDERVAGDKVDIGADEVTCTDTSHPNDWNFDGVIDMADFSILSAAWLTHDPNDPALSDPNTWDPNDYTFDGWNPVCDLDDDYAVDLADLLLFCEDDPQNWLWIACWRTDLLELLQQQSQQMMAIPSGEQESMMLLPITELSSMEQTAIEELPIVEEKSIEEQILDLQDCIEFLEQIWLEEPDIQQEIDSEAWQEFMNSVYQSMTELQTQITE